MVPIATVLLHLFIVCLSLYVSVTLVHLAKAVGQNEVPCGRDARVVPG